MMRCFSGLLLVAAVPAGAASSSPSKKPPLGWSSWYAMGQSVNQTAMEETYAKLTNRSVCKTCP